MSDERLRLVAELQNKASAELKKLQRDMGDVKPSAGMLQAKTWFTQLSAASDTATRATRPLIGGLNMIGAGGLAAGLSIAGLAKQFTDLAKALPALQELSRQTGMSRTEIERLKAAASNLNVDPSKMQASLGNFSRMMVEFHKRSGTLYEEMVNHGSAGLAEKIRQEDPAAAYKDILRWLDAIPAAAQRAGRSAADAVQIQRHWAGEALGDEDMAQLVSKGMGGFTEAYRQAAQDVGQITDEMVAQAEKFDRSLARFDRSWTTLKQDLGTTVLPGLTAATDGMRALFDELKHDPELIGIGAASIGALYARKKIMGAMTGGAGGISSAAASQIEGAAVKQSTATTTFAEAVAEFRAGVREMAGRNAGPGGSPVKEAEKGGESFASKLKSALPALATGGALAAVGAGIAAVILNRDQSKSLVDGGRPDVLPSDNNLGLPGIDDDAQRRSPSAPAFHPDDDRLSRARAADAPDHSLDGVVVGALERPMLRLVGTLKTAVQTNDNILPAAFHPAALGASLAAGIPGEIVAAAVKAGTLAAFREWAGMQDLDGKGGGIMSASFGGGGGGGGGGGASGGYSGAAAGRPNMRYGRGGHTPGGDPYPWQGGSADTGGAGATSGMRARNLGNIGFFNQHEPGLLGPSNSRDVDHSIALFATQEDGIRAAARLALRKYQGGKRNLWDLIAGRPENGRATLTGAWTPGSLGGPASVNMAKAMGIGNQDDLHLDDPARMRTFLRALAVQEHGKAGSAFYSPEMIDRALNGKGATTTTGASGSAGGVDLGNGQTAITTRSGRMFRVGSAFAENFRGFINDFEAAGGNIRDIGGYRPTNIAGTNILSFHAQNGGRAIDINQSARNIISSGLPGGIAQEEALAHKWGLRAGSEFRSNGPDRGHYEVNDPERARAALEANRVAAAKLSADHGEALRKVQEQERREEERHFKSLENPFTRAANKLETAADHQTHAAGSTMSSTRHLLKWFRAGSRADDPSDTPITTIDRRDPKFAPHIAPMPRIAPEPPRNAVPTADRDDDPAHVHVHVHEDGRVRSVRAKNSTGVQIKLHTGRTLTQFA